VAHDLEDRGGRTRLVQHDHVVSGAPAILIGIAVDVARQLRALKRLLER
jgi:hypothetical protein